MKSGKNGQYGKESRVMHGLQRDPYIVGGGYSCVVCTHEQDKQVKKLRSPSKGEGKRYQRYPENRDIQEEEA